MRLSVRVRAQERPAISATYAGMYARTPLPKEGLERTLSDLRQAHIGVELVQAFPESVGHVQVQVGHVSGDP